jgi:hypothetical protein
MCRSIKVLRNSQLPATNEDITAASLQFVRKISGYRAPSQKNAEAFELAVREIADASKRLLEAIGNNKPDNRAAAG